MTGEGEDSHAIDSSAVESGSDSLPAVFSLLPLPAQVQPQPSDTPTFRVTSRLVFLDVTVLDAKAARW